MKTASYVRVGKGDTGRIKGRLPRWAKALKWRVYLEVGVQSFVLANDADNRDEAEWTARQLRVALNRLQGDAIANYVRADTAVRRLGAHRSPRRPRLARVSMPRRASPFYRNYLRSLMQLHELIQQGQGDEPEADKVRDTMDDFWYRMSEAEQRRAAVVSANIWEQHDRKRSGRKAVHVRPA